MQTYKCYILDDEPLALKVIEQHLAKFDQFEVCGTSTEPLKAFGQIKSLNPDLLFIDIEMPEITGLELIESLQNKPEIIITTAYREFAVEGFELKVLDYLVKPIPFPRFLKAIDRFLEIKNPGSASLGKIAPSTIFVKADRKTVKIKLDDILYVQGVKDYVKIVLPDQRIMTNMSIGNFLRELPSERFLRVHKSYIVSKNKITAYTNHDVEIGDLEIPIGRAYKAQFLKEME